MVANLDLGLGQGHLPGTNLSLELRLESILDVRSHPPTIGQSDRIRLRPEFFRIGRIATELERDEVSSSYEARDLSL